ncbi:hypothetical protein QJS04_geneDACA006631 [Acorus gramineus]|uniref:Uncharacterized protein n=1 Tax=Acorus gramineus TaxID=55184 RepID=A0AAV9A2Q0_ACOGR|nr:hypothetical protein QJS04_geneDACA006631 [Acorus gramineus]
MVEVINIESHESGLDNPGEEEEEEEPFEEVLEGANEGPEEGECRITHSRKARGSVESMDDVNSAIKISRYLANEDDANEMKMEVQLKEKVVEGHLREDLQHMSRGHPQEISHKVIEAMNRYARLSNEERLLYIQRVEERRKRRKTMSDAARKEGLGSTSHSTNIERRRSCLLRAQLNSYEHQATTSLKTLTMSECGGDNGEERSKALDLPTNSYTTLQCSPDLSSPPSDVSEDHIFNFSVGQMK